MAGDETEIDSEFARFDLTPTAADASSDYRNKANGHGYITEIDPYNLESMATRRTAMGRFRHASCVFNKLVEGKPIVFFVTIAKYLDEGVLYVARFDEGAVG